MKKENLQDLPAVYAVGTVSVDGVNYFLGASELRDGAAYMIDPADGTSELIWKGPGGVMAMIGADENTFLSIDEFYPVFDSAKAAVYKTVVSGPRGSHVFSKEKLFDLPWCHRIAFVHQKDGHYIVAGTLCKEKSFVEDWSTKGSVYVAKYSNGTVGELKCIFSEAILKHHAMWVHYNGEGSEDVYVGGAEGSFKCFMDNGAWKVEQVLMHPTSDITIGDFDGDGEEELAIIEDFHGNEMKIFKKIEGVYNEILSAPVEFGHVLWSGKITGKTSILLGSRAGEKFLKLFRVRKVEEGFHLEETLIDSAVGPAQIAVMNEPNGSTVIITAEHGVNMISKYCLGK